MQAAKTLAVHQYVYQLPFHSSSFLGDTDNDVLPYPTSGARRGKQLKKSDKKHFFLLTSKEAIEYKQKEKEEKLAREQKKQEKINKRVMKKEMLLQKKENGKPRNNRRNAKTSQRKINIEVNSTMKEITNSKATSKKKRTSRDTKESESCSCFVCGEEYIDPPTEEWIQCNSCAVWVHEECANIEGTVFNCENCD